MPTRQNDGQVLVTVKADGTGDVGQVCVVGVCLAVHWPKSVFFVLVGGDFDRRWNLFPENRLFSVKKLCWLNSWTTAEKIVLAQHLDNSCTTAAHSLNSWKVSGT